MTAPLLLQSGAPYVQAMSVLSTIDYVVPVRALGPGSPNPTGNTVQFAFKTIGTDPGSSDWVSGSWGGTVNSVYLAQCLVGPANGGTALSIGSYVAWMKVTSTPEVPVGPVGTLTVTP